jgi:ribosomal protein S15P/S13E
MRTKSTHPTSCTQAIRGCFPRMPHKWSVPLSETSFGEYLDLHRTEFLNRLDREVFWMCQETIIFNDDFTTYILIILLNHYSFPFVISIHVVLHQSCLYFCLLGSQEKVTGLIWVATQRDWATQVKHIQPVTCMCAKILEWTRHVERTFYDRTQQRNLEISVGERRTVEE